MGTASPSWFADVQLVLNPHGLFVELLHTVAFDSTVAVDWLSSNETAFLEYLLRYHVAPFVRAAYLILMSDRVCVVTLAGAIKMMA